MISICMNDRQYVTTEKEIPRKEDVSVANIKHKKGLEKDQQPQATSPFQWHGPKQWRRCEMSLSR